ncbi:MAG: hypothetical protein ACKOUM_09475 [Sphingopyxis sp.]
MRGTWDDVSVRLYMLDDADVDGGARTLIYGRLADALQFAAGLSEQEQAALYLQTDNDVVSYQDFMGDTM